MFICIFVAMLPVLTNGAWKVGEAARSLALHARVHAWALPLYGTCAMAGPRPSLLYPHLAMPPLDATTLSNM